MDHHSEHVNASKRLTRSAATLSDDVLGIIIEYLRATWQGSFVVNRVTRTKFRELKVDLSG
jgi:hypothetical protein